MEEMLGRVVIDINDYNKLIKKLSEQEKEIADLKNNLVISSQEMNTKECHIEELESAIINESLKELEYYIKHSFYDLKDCLNCNDFETELVKLRFLHISPEKLVEPFTKAYNKEHEPVIPVVPAKEEVKEVVDAALVSEELPLEEV